MVSSRSLMKELEITYAALRIRSLNIHNFDKPASGIVFDIITIETGIAGIADTIISTGVVSREHLEILKKPIFIDACLVRMGGIKTDLSVHPDLLEHVKLIDHVRSLCRQVAGDRQGRPSQ